MTTYSDTFNLLDDIFMKSQGVIDWLLLCRGYMAPEYALWGYLTDKADVYSFGVVALELVSGKNNIKYRPNENFVCLVDWVRSSSYPISKM